MLPPLSIQALVENAVRHGITVKEEGGEICIIARNTGAFYEVSIVDDGVGFDVSRKFDSSEHIGIQNVRKRLTDIRHATLEVKSEVGCGTQAIIRIPHDSKDQGDEARA